MKMLTICCASSKIDELRELLDRHDVRGYTEMPALRGSGATGKHLGTRAHPGACSMVLTAVESEKVGELLDALRAMQAGCSPDEGLRVMVLPVEQML